jgi:hypothetical protein
VRAASRASCRSCLACSSSCYAAGAQRCMSCHW